MISIVIPTYNEKKNISKIKNNLKKIKITNEVIFVDDYSSDGTFNEIVKYRSKRIKGYLRASLKKDLSKSVFFGVKKAKYNNILVMDCDLQHNPIYINKMWTKYKSSNLDLVVANRFGVQKMIGNLGLLRSLVSLSTISIINFIFGKKTQDPLSGFFLCKKSIILKYRKSFFLCGYKILFDIIYNGDQNLNIGQQDIIFNRRQSEKSKFNLRIIAIFIKQMIFTKFVAKSK